MELALAPVLLVIIAVVILAGLGAGALILVKLGVIAHYALKKDEPPGEGKYGLEQSHEVERHEHGAFNGPD